MSLELYYNGVALHQLGTVRQLGETSTGVPEEMPDRWVVTTSFSIDTAEPNYKDNRTIIGQVIAALKMQERNLKWSGDGATWIEQTAQVVSHDLPEDPNAWGTYHQRIHIVFRFERAVDVTHLQAATFLKSGGAGPALSLGSVVQWKESFRTQAFHEMRNHRKFVGGTVTATGRILVSDPGLSLSARRAELLAAKEALTAELLNKDGALVFGSAFNKVVKVEAFDAQVDQVSKSVGWVLSAVYTRFPNESNYAVAEYSAKVSDTLESGDQRLIFAGKIGAQDEATARAKLDLLRTSVLSAMGFASANKEGSETDVQSVSQSPPSGGDASNTDGTTFIELSFSESFLKRRSDVLSYHFVMSEAEDVTSNLTRVTYSGSVQAGGANAAAAYAAALAKAQELGSGKYQMMRASNITAEYRKTGTTTTGTEELATLTFSYEYQRKGSGRVYLDFVSETSNASFAVSQDAVSGYVVADTEANARSVYASKVKALFASRLIEGESTRASTQKIAKVVGPAVETGRGETLDGDSNYVTQVVRVEFSFQVHRAKLSTETAMKYETAVEEDFVAKEKVTTVRGMVMAETLAAAQAFVDTYFYFDSGLGKYRWGGAGGTILGKRVQRSNASGAEVANRVDGSSKVEVFTGLNFSWQFREPLTSDEQILECELEEEIQFAGTRYVIQPVVDGASVVQNTGIQEGSRTINGSVMALTETAAKAWVSKQMGLPFPSWGAAAPGTRYVHPPRVKTQFKAVSLTDMVGRAGDYGGSTGVLSGGAVNIKACVMSFSVEEVLPDYYWS